MLRSVGTKNTLHLLLESKLLCKLLLIFSQSYIKMVVSFYSTGHVRNVFLNNYLKFLHLILDGDVLTKLKTYPNVEIVNELS